MFLVGAGSFIGQYSGHKQACHTSKYPRASGCEEAHILAGELPNPDSILTQELEIEVKRNTVRSAFLTCQELYFMTVDNKHEKTMCLQGSRTANISVLLMNLAQKNSTLLSHLSLQEVNLQRLVQLVKCLTNVCLSKNKRSAFQICLITQDAYRKYRYFFQM